MVPGQRSHRVRFRLLVGLGAFFSHQFFDGFLSCFFGYFGLQKGSQNPQKIGIFRSPVCEHFFLRFPGVFLVFWLRFGIQKPPKTLEGSLKIEVFTFSAWSAFWSDFWSMLAPFWCPKRSQNPSGRHAKKRQSSDLHFGQISAPSKNLWSEVRPERAFWEGSSAWKDLFGRRFGLEGPFWMEVRPGRAFWYGNSAWKAGRKFDLKGPFGKEVPPGRAFLDGDSAWKGLFGWKLGLGGPFCTERPGRAFLDEVRPGRAFLDSLEGPFGMEVRPGRAFLDGSSAWKGLFGQRLGRKFCLEGPVWRKVRPGPFWMDWKGLGGAEVRSGRAFLDGSLAWKGLLGRSLAWKGLFRKLSSRLHGSTIERIAEDKKELRSA